MRYTPKGKESPTRVRETPHSLPVFLRLTTRIFLGE